jgi:hypothetical protein
MPRVIIGILTALSVSCGTALYNHSISVVPVEPQARLTVSVFDHQAGYSRDWAHQSAGVAESGRPYRATLTTTAAVTMADTADARPLTIALAIPEVSDEGYFLLTVDRELQGGELPASYCRYGEYFPPAGAATIPVRVTAHAVKGDWSTEMQLDLGRIKTAFTKR